MALTAAKAKKILEDGTIRGKALTEKQKKFFGAVAGGATPLKKLNGGWLDKFQDGGDVSFDSVQRAIRNVESLDGKLMWNPESTATGLYGQLFSQVKDDYPGTRREFAADTLAQKKFFKNRFFEGLPSTQTTSLVKDANDIYQEYASQIPDFNYSKEDLAVLSNFLGRQGTREYLGYHVRDKKPLEQALPNIYGSDAKQRNKTPEQYLEQARKYYKEGGWLDKFDNGGVQPNYNNSNVSLPPGFKGYGYDKGGRAYNGAWDGPVAQDGQRVADIATRWEMNEIDSGRPPLNIVEKVRSWFDPDSCVRDNTCVQTVKDIQSEAGIYAIPDDVYNNREFLKNYKQYGFTEITDEKDLQPGDILQYYSRDEKEAEKDPNYVDFPYHMGIYVSPGEYISDGDSKAPTQRKNMYYEYDSKGNRYDKDPFRIFRYTPPKKQMGGSLPGATGMMYARTSGTSPEEPKKAQDGRAMLSQYEEPAWYEKVLDYVASPMTTLGYLARGEDLPDRLPINVPGRSEYDNWNFDMINPAAWIKYGASARRNFEEGEYLDSAFDALSAIPIVPAWLSKGKKPVKAATKAAKNIETEPLRDLFIQPNIHPTSSPLPKNMEPYLSKRVYPFNKEQEVFESFLPTEAQLKNIDEKSIYLNQKGLQKIDNSKGSNIEYVYKNIDGDEVAKFTGVKKGDAIDVTGINVSEPYRRQGIGQSIYEEIAKETPLTSRSTQQQFTLKDDTGRSISPSNELWEKLVKEGKAEKIKQQYDWLYKTKFQEGGEIDKAQWGALLKLAKKYGSKAVDYLKGLRSEGKIVVQPKLKYAGDLSLGERKKLIDNQIQQIKPELNKIADAKKEIVENVKRGESWKYPDLENTLKDLDDQKFKLKSVVTGTPDDGNVWTNMTRYDLSDAVRSSLDRPLGTIGNSYRTSYGGVGLNYDFSYPSYSSLNRQSVETTKEYKTMQDALEVLDKKARENLGMFYNTMFEKPSRIDYGDLLKYQNRNGGVIEDDRGQWAYPGEITKINSNNITMKGVNYPVLGISDTGDKKMMQPGKDYKFKGNSVTEFPMAKDGKSLVELNQLTNFTNYNTPQPGGWLDKYH